jgi:hypothetical protein
LDVDCNATISLEALQQEKKKQEFSEYTSDCRGAAEEALKFVDFEPYPAGRSCWFE